MCGKCISLAEIKPEAQLAELKAYEVVKQAHGYGLRPTTLRVT